MIEQKESSMGLSWALSLRHKRASVSNILYTHPALSNVQLVFVLARTATPTSTGSLSESSPGNWRQNPSSLLPEQSVAESVLFWADFLLLQTLGHSRGLSVRIPLTVRIVPPVRDLSVNLRGVRGVRSGCPICNSNRTRTTTRTQTKHLFKSLYLLRKITVT